MAHQWQDSCNARTVDEHVGTRVILLALACVPAKRDRALQRSATALPDYTAKRSPHDMLLDVERRLQSAGESVNDDAQCALVPP